MPMIAGVHFKEIVSALTDAFEQFELASMLRNEMDERLDRIVAPGRFDQVVFELVQWAERTGRELELMRSAYRVKPRHAGMSAVYRRYGLAPDISFQRSGALVPVAVAETPEQGLEKIIKQNLPVLDVALWREQLSAMEGRVCRVELNDPGNSMGTGFLVGPDAVLTNYHVLRPVLDGALPKDQVRFRFDFKKLANGLESDGVTAALHASEWQIDHSPYSAAEARGTPDDPPPTEDELDYALVRLESRLGDAPINRTSDQGMRRGWIRVPDSDPAISDASLFILQHPRRAPLKLAMDTQADPQIVHGGRRMRYATTTDAGSSGSPCFNVHWSLIALHHYGDPDWSTPKYNQGVPVGRIRDRLVRIGKASDLGGDPPSG